MKTLFFKNFFIISALSVSLVSAAKPSADLEIFNDWSYPVHVKVVYIGNKNMLGDQIPDQSNIPSDQDIAAGSKYSKSFPKFISDLSIGYKPDNSDEWKPIPGCSRGTYDAATERSHVLLKVYITSKDSDPRIPACRSEIVSNFR